MAAGTATDVLRDLVEVYAAIRSERGERQFVKGEGWAVSRPVHVAPTMEEARRNFEVPVVRQREFQLLNRDPVDYMKNHYGESSAPAQQKPVISWEMLLERAMLAGPPEHVVEQVHELREVCGIENVITFMDAGGVPHDKIMQSLELFGTKVMPEFQ